MNKTVLLTGGAGFIGAHTVEHILKTTDWNVIILDRLTYAGNLNRLTDIDIWNDSQNRVRFYFHDFRSKFSDDKIYQLYSLFGSVDYIIHMGAESHVDNSIENPYPFVESNVVGTVNMLELLKNMGSLYPDNKPSRFIYVSTDEVYGPAMSDLHLEEDPHRPSNPYSASKAAGEDFCIAYTNTYDLPIIITRTMNNFGERQDKEKFLPIVVNNIINEKSINIHCKMDVGEKVLDISSRCWLHARNHSDGLIFLLKNGIIGHQYNIVGEKKSVYELAKEVGYILNIEPKINFVDFHSFRPGNDMHYGLDGKKMKQLGWIPPMSLEDSLESTVKWMLNNKHWM